MTCLNPIRYRGYYYDTETGLYYLRARYYDPETGRFISQDDVSYLAPTHMFGVGSEGFLRIQTMNLLENLLEKQKQQMLMQVTRLAIGTIQNLNGGKDFCVCLLILQKVF